MNKSYEAFGLRRYSGSSDGKAYVVRYDDANPRGRWVKDFSTEIEAQAWAAKQNKRVGHER